MMKRLTISILLLAFVTFAGYAIDNSHFKDIIWEEMPIIPLMEQDNTWANKNIFDGILIYPDGAINVRNATIK